MQFGADERAAAIQVGATLLFGMVIVSMALYQATVVPDQNAEVEYNHNQEVQGQLQELRNAVVSVPGGTSKSVTVDLGTRYPSRTLFVNPPAPSGSLRTVGTATDSVEITVDNAETSGETGHYWNGSERTFGTGAIEYEPRYSEYWSAPTTVYEQSVLYNRFDGANVSISDQRIVDGRQINLVALNGSLSESAAGSESVSVRAVSTSQNAVAVTGQNDDPVEITIPTRLDEDTWDEALAEATDGGNVVGTSYDPGPGEFSELTIRLDGSKTYDLRMAKVGVGDGVKEEAEDLYLTDVEGGGSVETGGSQAVTVEVRDRYNNPVSGERVNVSLGGDRAGELDNGTTNGTSVTGQSGSDGRVTVTYEAPDSEASDAVTANISATPDSTERVKFEIDVVSTGGGGSNESKFEIYGPDGIESIRQGETLSVDAEIANTGETEGTQVIDLSFEGEDVVDSEMVTIPEEEPATVPLSYENTDGKLGDYDVTVHSDDDARTNTVTIEEPPNDPYFDVTIDSTNSPINEGNTLSTDVVIENIGDSSDTQSVTMDYGSDANVDSQSVTLDPDESRTITLTHDTSLGDAGDVDVTVESENTSDTETVTVESPGQYFDVLLNDTNAPIGAGETLKVDVDLKNRGDETAEQEIALDFDDDGSTDSRKFVELTGGEERTVTLTYDLPADTATGEHDFQVASGNDSDTATAEIESPTDFGIDNMAVSDIVEGEDLDVVVDITNGGGTGTETVELSVGTLGGDSRDLTLDSGESASIELTYASEDGDAGDYLTEVTVENDQNANDVTILHDPEYIVDLDRSTVPDQVARNKEFGVSATIENQGEVGGEQDVELRLGSNVTGVEGEDYSVVDTAPAVTLDGGDSTAVNLAGSVPGDQPLGDQDIGVVTNDDSGVDTTTVNVEPGFSQLNATGDSTGGRGNSNVDSVTFDYVIKDDVDADRIEYTVRTDGERIVGENTDDTPIRDGTVTVELDDNYNMDNVDLDVNATVVDTGGYSTACVGTIQNDGETIRKSDGQFACS